MKSFILFFLFPAFIFSPLHAQDHRADSLYAIWSDTSNTAEDRVEAFYQRFDPLINEVENPETIRWAQGIIEARTLVQDLGKTQYLGRFLFLESATYLFMMNDMEKSCQIGREAIQKSLEVQDYETADIAHHFLRNCSDNNIDEMLEQALSLDTLMADQIPLYNALIRTYFGKSHLPEALDLAQRVILFVEANNLIDHLNHSVTLGLVGNTHLITGNYAEAENYLLPSLTYAKKSNFSPEIGSSFIDLATLYIDKKDLTKARLYLDSAMVYMVDRQDCAPCMAKARRVEAGLKNLEEKYPLALKELLALQDYYDTQPLTLDYNLGKYYAELSNSYLGMHQYASAISAALTGIEKSHGNLYGSLQSYENIYKAYESIGNDEKAFEYYKKYIDARDEITQVRNAQLVTKQELAFQYQQQHLADSLRREQKNAQQEFVFQQEINRQKNNRNLFLALGVLATLIALGMYTRYRFVQKNKKQLEEKNKSIEIEKKRAEASEKAKHQFLANMSHEIRTPMNAIKGMTDILLRKDPRPQQMSYLNAIKESSNSLLVIINDILDMSKIEAGKIELESIPFSLEDVIQNVVMISHFKAEEKGLLIQVNKEDELPVVQGDPTRLHQVLLNLLDNAIKFTEKGVVTLQLETEVSADQNELMTHFCISDTGVGIGEDRLEKIFESFEQAYSDTSRKFGGTGLGLTISRRLVQLQGGEIQAKSSKGKGSQFHVTIPYQLSKEHSTQIAATGVQSQLSQVLKGIRVLLVEDNHFNAIVAQEELEDSIDEVQVELAENGLIAVEKVTHGAYDVVLMDVQMPVMNGYEATEAIRQLSNGKSQIPIIAMTANVMREEVDRCYEAGMNDFIGKPFDTQDLLSKIQKLKRFSNSEILG